MATGSTLADLIKEVQYELGHSVNATIGQNFRDHIANRIRREYKRLYDDFVWPHLRAWVDLPIVAGTDHYTLPTVDVNGDSVALRLGDLLEVYVRHNNIYVPLGRGIEVQDYNGQNSDLDQRTDPVRKWAPLDETTIQVWPKPSAPGALRFLVKKPFVQMEAETDICLLDDFLVSMFAASEYLARQGSKDASAVAVRAEGYYKTLRQRLQRGQNKVSLLPQAGGDPRDPRHRVLQGVDVQPTASDLDAAHEFLAALDFTP